MTYLITRPSASDRNPAPLALCAKQQIARVLRTSLGPVFPPSLTLPALAATRRTSS
ncbi:hypothetical protein [Cupriavidus pampae]|uniref:Uncharacterized protein n=1 Tax=Cupriavidus pampae TaxID=659251 RepID=A0ABM8XVG8_9BURK|nr:hypothetical protein [Cupriavidus pampae]CAG9184376.1 hypothetical protein LMG32289_05600 [Cupriavidus pampae]